MAQEVARHPPRWEAAASARSWATCPPPAHIADEVQRGTQQQHVPEPFQVDDVEGGDVVGLALQVVLPEALCRRSMSRAQGALHDHECAVGNARASNAEHAAGASGARAGRRMHGACTHAHMQAGWEVCRQACRIPAGRQPAGRHAGKPAGGQTHARCLVSQHACTPATPPKPACFQNLKPSISALLSQNGV